MLKTILITGAARRLGAAMARALAGDGWRVIVHYNHSAGEAALLRAGILAAGGACELVQADLGDPAAVAGLVPDCTARFGRLHALINNASSFAYDSLASMTQQSWDTHMATNLHAPVFLAQAFAAQPPEGGTGQEGGAIINLLDHKITAPNPDFFSYTIAKLAQAAATKLLAQALRGRVRVNAIAPGITLISGKQTEEGFNRAWSAPPLGRSSTPDEVADAARYILATPGLNGQIIALDGGDGLLQRPRDIAFETEADRAPGT